MKSEIHTLSNRLKKLSLSFSVGRGSFQLHVQSPPLMLDLVKKMLVWNPNSRITPTEALQLPYLQLFRTGDEEKQIPRPLFITKTKEHCGPKDYEEALLTIKRCLRWKDKPFLSLFNICGLFIEENIDLFSPEQLRVGLTQDVLDSTQWLTIRLQKRRKGILITRKRLETEK